MGWRMTSCWSSIRSCWARGSASLRREPRHAHSSSSARKRWHRASSSTPTGPTDLCGSAPWAHRHSDLRGRTQMRKLIFAINTTLDGCVDHTKQFVDEEKLEYFTHLTREVDLQVDLSREVSKIFKFFFIDKLFGVVDAAIQGRVDRED